MVAPQINIRVTDLTLYAPRRSNAVMGCVGPATKGPINTLSDFTDEGNFTNFHGRRIDRMYGPRGFNRYLKRGDQGKYVRIAGPNLAFGTLTLYAVDGITPILNFTLNSAGSWGDDGFIQVAVTHNGTASYNLQVFEDGQPTDEVFIGINNGIVETRVNNTSTRVVVSLAFGAGATFPAQTINPVTNALDPQGFTGGDDGAFAKSESASSSTSGVAGRRFFGKMDSVAGSRVFSDLFTIDATLAGLDIAYGTLGHPAVPGTVTVRCQVGASSYVELSDDGDGGVVLGGGGFGILEGTSAVGYIDYRTGAFGVDISGTASSFFATGTFSTIFVKAAAEGVGATVAGQGAYAGNLSRFKLAPGFFNANKLVITVPIDEQVGDAAVGVAGEASSTATLKSLAGWIVPGTVILTPNHPTDAVPPPVYDDGFGGWRSAPIGSPGVAVAGTLDYRTGAWAITPWDPVGGVSFPGVTAAQIQAEYDIQMLNMGGGAVPGDANGDQTQVVQPSDAGGDAAASDVDAGAARIVGPISPGTVVLVISSTGGSGSETFYDDGVGGWLTRPRGDPRAAAAAGGALDYVTGEWSITAAASIDALASITADYTQTPFDRARRHLRGTGPQFVADTTPNAAGVNLDAPAAANDYNGTNFVDHTTGAFGLELDLVETGTNTFNVKDNGAMTAVYLPVAEILGFGDGTEPIFIGSLDPAPFRRQNNRLVAFQSAQSSSAVAGDLQVAFATLDTLDPADDHWTQNVAAPSDPNNFLGFGTGDTSVQWTGAPTLDEAVFVAADEVVLHFLSRYPGDIGNERAILTDGLWVSVDADPTLAGTIRARVLFTATGEVESFGQAPTLNDLARLINDSLNGSDFVRADVTDDAGLLDADLTAAQSVGMAGAFTQADVVGTKVGSVTTGIQMFRNPDIVPLDWIMVPGQWHSGVVNALRNLCEKPGRRCIGIVPTPDTENAFEVRDFVNAEWNSGPGLPPVATALVPFPPTSLVDSRQLAVFAPWVTYLDGDAVVTEPPDGDMAALVANTDSQAEPWYPIAGGRRGRVLAEGVKYSTELEDRNLIYGLVGSRIEIVNSVVAFSNRGLQLAGQRTAQRTATSLDRINVSWTVNVIANRIDAGAHDFEFELNDTILWRQIKSFIEGILGPIKERRGLIDFFVIVDQTTTTAADIDNLRVRAKIFIKPARATEFLDFDIILTPTGADFADVSASSSI